MIMKPLGKAWKKIPATVRKPIVMVVGLLFIIAAAATGWLPGPGGIPLFLIGIAILATEFEWAERIRDGVLSYVEKAGLWLRHHPVVGPFLIAAATCIAISIAYVLFS